MKKKLLSLQDFIAKEIQVLLRKENYSEGDRLPGERTLADRFGVQRQTVRTALSLLERKGIIATRDRSGHYVARAPLQVNLNQFLDTEYLIRKDNGPVEWRVIDFEKTLISRHLMYKMHIREGTEIYRILMLWSKHEEPVCLERSYILCGHVPILKKKDLETRSRYSVLPAAYIDQKMEVFHAETLESELLRVPLLQPMLKFSGFTFNDKNECIEYFERITTTDSHIFYC